MNKRIFILLVLFLGWPFQVFANQWQIDTVHTNFFFDVKHVYSTVRGQFGEFTGDVYFDPALPEKSKFDFTIKVDSIDTKVGKRDTHLRSPDFFDEGKYPYITFKSKRVVPTGGDKYLVEGILTIKDVSKPLMLEFVLQGLGDNPLKPDQMIAGFDSRLEIDRLEYHVGDGKFYKMGVVDKDVAIFITLELLRDK